MGKDAERWKHVLDSGAYMCTLLSLVGGGTCEGRWESAGQRPARVGPWRTLCAQKSINVILQGMRSHLRTPAGRDMTSTWHRLNHGRQMTNACSMAGWLTAWMGEWRTSVWITKEWKSEWSTHYLPGIVEEHYYNTESQRDRNCVLSVDNIRFGYMSRRHKWPWTTGLSLFRGLGSYSFKFAEAATETPASSLLFPPVRSCCSNANYNALLLIQRRKLRFGFVHNCWMFQLNKPN